jgi:hypothetical protein
VKKTILLTILVSLLLVSFVSAGVWTEADIVFYYTMDNDNISGSTVYDETGTYDGTLQHDAAGGSAGKLGEAVDFDGNQDHISLNIGDYNARSLNYWAYFDDDSKTNVQYQESNYRLSVWTDSSSNLRMFAGGVPQELNCAYTTGGWHMITAVVNYTGEIAYLYYDGSQCDSLNVSQTQYGGTDTISISTALAMDGRLDEFGFWNKALHPSEVTQLWNGGAGLPYGESELPLATIYATDIAGGSLDSFSVRINGTVHRTTNGTIYHTFESDEQYKAEFDSVVVDSPENDGYFTQEHDDINFSHAPITFNLTNSILQLSADDWEGSMVTNFQAERNGSVNKSTTGGTLYFNVTKGEMELLMSSSSNGGYVSTWDNFTATGNTTIVRTGTFNPLYGYCHANDTFSGQDLMNISAEFDGDVYWTANGTLYAPFLHQNDYTTTREVTVDSHDNDGYFTQVFNGVDWSINNTFSIRNAIATVVAVNQLDESTITSFKVQVNNTNYTSVSSEVNLNLSKGLAEIFTYADGYEFNVSNFTISGNTTHSMNFTMSKVLEFNIIREATNEPFDFSQEENMTMTVYCSGASQLFNVTSNNFTEDISCSFDSIVLSHQNGTQAYFRSLIPTYNQTLVKWYTLDLNYDTGVQILINLVDLTGEYSTGIIRAKRYFDSTLAEIIEQNFDIEDSVNLYLLKSTRYTLEVCNDDGACRSLGEIISDVAEEKTMFIPNIDFYPTESLLGNLIQYDINWTPNNRIQLTYEDDSENTTYVEFLVYNGSNTTHLYYNNTVVTSSLTATYVIPAAYYNTSFIACVVAHHPDLTDLIRHCEAFQEYEDDFGHWEGFNETEQYKVKFWGSLLFLVLIGLLFSKYSIEAGLTAVNFFLWLFIQFRWLITGNSVYDYTILGVSIVLSVIYIVGLKNGGGRG